MMQDEHQDTINAIFASTTHDSDVSATLFGSANDNSQESSASSSISTSQIAASQYSIEVNIYSWEERTPPQAPPQASGRPLLDSLRKLKTSVASSNTFIIFNIEVQRGPHKWKVERRYSEFAQFDQQLRNKFPYLPLPDLPPKGSVGSSTEDKSQTFLNNRMKLLAEYLSKLVQLPTIRDSEDLRTFLNDETPTPAQQAQGTDGQQFHAADSQTVKSGQLTLTDMGILNKSKPAWIVLTDIALAYYNEQKDTKVQGFVLLTGWGEVKVPENDETKFSVVTGDKTLHLMAADAETRSSWVTAIQKVLKVSFDLIVENSQKVEFEASSDDPFLKLKLEPGQCVYAQPSTVLFYEPGIELKAQLATKDDKNKKRAIGRLVLLGQIFLVQVSNDSEHTKEVTLSSTSSLLSIDLSEHGGMILCQRETFMCCPFGVDISVGVNNAMLGLSGQGIVFQRIVGGTTIHLSVTGSVIERELKEGDCLIVESGAIVALESTVKMAVETRFDIVNKVLGGVSLMAVKVTGPGKVWIQSVTPGRASLASFTPLGRLLK